MKLRKSFTLIELLIVVGIIALLAGLITPAVISAQQKGRITQAKNDMHSIIMALKGVEATYGKMLNNTGTASSPKFGFVDGEAKVRSMTHKSNNVEYQWTAVGPEKDTSDKDIKIYGEKLDTDSYDALIAELSDPKNKEFSSASKLNFNKRRQVFLDPKSEYNPGVSYNADSNKPHLWLDPWGSRYIILINTNATGAVANPADTMSGATSKALVAAPVAVISLGPNGIWNSAKNAEVNYGDPAATDDDIASWHR